MPATISLLDAQRMVLAELEQLCRMEGSDCYTKPQWIVGNYVLTTADLIAHVRALDSIGKAFIYMWAQSHGYAVR